VRLLANDEDDDGDDDGLPGVRTRENENERWPHVGCSDADDGEEEEVNYCQLFPLPQQFVGGMGWLVWWGCD